MVQESLLLRLEKTTGKKLKLKINDNRSTMLSVRWEPDHARVSLHRMFLDAPKNVMDALACYIGGKNKVLSPSIKAFIQQGTSQLRYTAPQNLEVEGKTYQLQAIYDHVNKQYFHGKLRLSITWFRNERRPRSKIALGLYYDSSKLIKINRVLDAPDVPHYVIAFIVYHEMLHYVCPAYVNEKGVHQVHTKEFKASETQFLYYHEAQAWIRQNHSKLFKRI